MEGFIPDKLLDLLSISAVLSVVLMALIQKIKLTTIVKSKCQIWLINIILSLHSCVITYLSLFCKYI